MIRAKGQLWETITNGKRQYRLRELEIEFEEAKYHEVLREARKKAKELNRTITIDAFYEGRWFEVDEASPSDWSQ